MVAVDDGGIVAAERFGGALKAERGDTLGRKEGVVAFDNGAEGFELAAEVDCVSVEGDGDIGPEGKACLLYTSPSPRDS